jgi:glycosyltransferase involved in cell wall biosynthesis
MENKIVIGVLAYNEEKYITKVMSELSSLNLPLLVIDDCSTDKTSSKLENLNINNMAILTNHKNLGAGGSTKALLKRAEQEGFSFLIKVDGDDQFLIDDVVKIIDLYKKKNYDFIKSNRFWENGIQGNIPKVRFFGNLFATILMQVSAGTNKVLDPLNGLFGVSVKINNFLKSKSYPKRYGYPYFITVTALINNFKTFQLNNVVKYTDQKSQINTVKMFFLLCKLTLFFYIKKLNLKKTEGRFQRSAFFDYLFIFFLINSFTFLSILIYSAFYVTNLLISTTTLLIISTTLVATTFYTFGISFKEEYIIRNRNIEIE